MDQGQVIPKVTPPLPDFIPDAEMSKYAAPDFIPDNSPLLAGASDEDLTSQYNTTLDPTQEASFQSWIQANPQLAPDLKVYDLRGYWKSNNPEMALFAQRKAHAPDTWKKPSHETFSDESIYATPDNPGGHWVGETFTPAQKRPISPDFISDEQMKGMPVGQPPAPPAMPPAMARPPQADLRLPDTAELPIPPTGGGESAPLFDPYRGKYMAGMNQRQGGVAIDPSKLVTEPTDPETQARIDKTLASVEPSKVEPSFARTPGKYGLGGKQATISPEKPYEPTGFARAVSVFLLPAAKEAMLGQAEIPSGLEETLAPRTPMEGVLSGAGKFAGFMGPAVMGGAKIGGMLTKPILEIFKTAGPSVANRLVETVITSGTGLGMAMAISDMKNPEGFFNRFGEGFKLGGIFGATAMIKIAANPVWSFLARQFGGRALMATAGQYADTSLSKENIPNFVFQELIYTWFFARPEVPGIVLKNLSPEKTGAFSERQAARALSSAAQNFGMGSIDPDSISASGNAKETLKILFDSARRFTEEKKPSPGLSAPETTPEAPSAPPEATPQAALPPRPGVPEAEATTLPAPTQKPAGGPAEAPGQAKQAIPGAVTIEVVQNEAGNGWKITLPTPEVGKELPKGIVPPPGSPAAEAMAKAETTAAVQPPIIGKAPIESIPEAQRTPEQAKLIADAPTIAAQLKDNPAFPTSGRVITPPNEAPLDLPSKAESALGEIRDVVAPKPEIKPSEISAAKQPYEKTLEEFITPEQWRIVQKRNDILAESWRAKGDNPRPTDINDTSSVESWASRENEINKIRDKKLSENDIDRNPWEPRSMDAGEVLMNRYRATIEKAIEEGKLSVETEMYPDMASIEPNPFDIEAAAHALKTIAPPNANPIVPTLSAAMPSVETKPAAKEPQPATRDEFRFQENKPKVDAIQARLAKGRSVVLTTHTKAIKLSRPDQIRIDKDGTVRIPQGRKWVALVDEQVVNLAAQAGVKPVPIEERAYFQEPTAPATPAPTPVTAPVRGTRAKFKEVNWQVESAEYGVQIRRIAKKNTVGLPKPAPESWWEIYKSTGGRMLKRYPDSMRQEWNSRMSGIPEYYFRKDGTFPDEAVSALRNPKIESDQDLNDYIRDDLRIRPNKTIEQQSREESAGIDLEYAFKYAQGFILKEMSPGESLSNADIPELATYLSRESGLQVDGPMVRKVLKSLTADGRIVRTEKGWELGREPGADDASYAIHGNPALGRVESPFDLFGNPAPAEPAKKALAPEPVQPTLFEPGERVPVEKDALPAARVRRPEFGETAPLQLELDETAQELRPALDAATPKDQETLAKVRESLIRNAPEVFNEVGLPTSVWSAAVAKISRVYDPSKGHTDEPHKEFVRSMMRYDVDWSKSPPAWREGGHRPPREVPLQEGEGLPNVADPTGTGPEAGLAAAQKTRDIKAMISEGLKANRSPNVERDTDIIYSVGSGEATIAEAAAKHDVAEATVKDILGKNKAALAKDEALRTRLREKGFIDPNLLTLGIPKFIEKDVIPGTKAAAEAVHQAAVSLRDFLAPVAGGKGATVAARILGENLAKKAMAMDRAVKETAKARKVFEKLGPKEGIDFQMGMEERVPGGPVYHGVDPAMTRAGEMFTRLLDRKVAEVQSVNPDALQNLIENYWPHQWKNPAKAASFYQEWFSRKPLEGSKAFLKKRSIPTMRDGIAAGLEPKFENPVDSILFKLSEMEKYIMAHRTFNSMKDAGELVFVKVSGQAPDGFVKIKDKIATVYAPPDLQAKTESGARIGSTILGHYYAPADAARIINNYYSPGLRGDKIFSAYLTLGNTLNQAQLGLSAFHLGFTSMDAMISKMALAINQISHADVGQGLKTLAAVPVAPFSNVLRGRLLKEEWMGGKPDYRNKASEAVGKGLDKFTGWAMPGAKGDMPKILEAMLSGGGRAQMDRLYATGFSAKMGKALRDGNLIGAGLRLPGALIEQASKPIMEYVVPLQKMGVYADLVRSEFKRMEKGNYTEVEKQDAARKMWRSVDNRMGQLVYDNLHWNKYLKDVSMASVRSLGWNLGAGAEVLGGVKDIATKGVGNILKGKAPELTYRASYVVAMTLMSGALGGLVHYLYNGKSPENVLDWYFPRTGRLDEQGREERVSLPSYMKDVYHVATGPGQTLKNKIHPAITSLLQLLENKDFYGVEISDSTMLSIKGLADRFIYTQKQLIPLSVRNIAREKALGAPLSEQVAPFFGVVRAPASISMSPAERVMNKALSERGSRPPIPKDVAETSAAERKFKSLVRQGATTPDQIPADVAEQIRALPPRKKTYLANEAQKTAFASRFGRLSLDDALAVWEKADPNERAQARVAMFTKISNAAQNDPAMFNKNREAIKKFVSEARSK